MKPHIEIDADETRALLRADKKLGAINVELTPNRVGEVEKRVGLHCLNRSLEIRFIGSSHGSRQCILRVRGGIDNLARLCCDETHDYALHWHWAEVLRRQPEPVPGSWVSASLGTIATEVFIPQMNIHGINIQEVLHP